MQVHQRCITRCLRVTVRHADHDGFLKPKHVAKIGGEIAEHRQLRRPRIGEYRRHPYASHEIDHGVSYRDAGGLSAT